ncbi:MAG: hypothetical protein OEV92_07805 [Nitrospinota bacterium]|nr:hypothetical protein [Nitrospinota bacterium]
MSANELSREKKISKSTLRSIFADEAKRILGEGRLAKEAADEAFNRFISLHPDLVDEF